MHDKASFTKIENELAPGFRQRVNSAEGIADLQQAFTTFLQDILGRVSGAEVALEPGDARIAPEAEDGYLLGPGISGNEAYVKLLEHSDLRDILRRQVEHAANKMKRLSRHTTRDETKLFPRKDRRR